MSSTSRGESFGESESERRKKNEGKKKTKKTTKKKYYYAVARGRTVGVYDTWDECNAQVRAYPGASHKVSRNILYSPSFSPFFVWVFWKSSALLCRPSANATRSERTICSDDPKTLLLSLFFYSTLM